jgi:hypothetical protein
MEDFMIGREFIITAFLLAILIFFSYPLWADETSQTKTNTITIAQSNFNPNTTKEQLKQLNTAEEYTIAKRRKRSKRNLIEDDSGKRRSVSRKSVGGLFAFSYSKPINIGPVNSIVQPPLTSFKLLDFGLIAMFDMKFSKHFGFFIRAGLYYDSDKTTAYSSTLAVVQTTKQSWMDLYFGIGFKVIAPISKKLEIFAILPAIDATYPLSYSHSTESVDIHPITASTPGTATPDPNYIMGKSMGFDGGLGWGLNAKLTKSIWLVFKSIYTVGWGNFNSSIGVLYAL